jgi:hypothetical protein
VPGNSWAAGLEVTYDAEENILTVRQPKGLDPKKSGPVTYRTSGTMTFVEGPDDDVTMTSDRTITVQSATGNWQGGNGFWSKQTGGKRPTWTVRVPTGSDTAVIGSRGGPVKVEDVGGPVSVWGDERDRGVVNRKIELIGADGRFWSKQ